MKIAILGGSFNPPHLGHLLIASQVKEHLQMDQIWLMPSYLHAFHKKLISAKHRLAMTRFLENEYIRVSDFEIKQKKVSYTIDTLNSLANKYPQDTFYWITGSDQLENFKRYKNWKEIIENHRLIIFPRETALPTLKNKVKKYLQLKRIPLSITIIDSEDIALTNISSTLIRQKIRYNKSISYLVPKKVERYIYTHSLYGD